MEDVVNPYLIKEGTDACMADITEDEDSLVGALQSYAAVIKLSPVPSGSLDTQSGLGKETLETMKTLGLDALALQKWDDAEVIFTTIAQCDPLNMLWYAYRGFAAAKGDVSALGGIWEAEKIFRLGKYALAALEAGEYDRAIELYTAIIDSGLATISDYQLRGAAYHRKGDYENALGDMTYAIKADPSAESSYSMRAKVYLELKSYDAAIHDYEEACKRDGANQSFKDGLEKAKLLAAGAEPPGEEE
jgi:tetratricopeptide (TPR) repeat protein